VSEAYPVYRKRKFPALKPPPTTEKFRGSARERGYDRKWDQMSAAHRRRHPCCEFCDQEGLVVLCDDVDHMIPISDGGPVHDIMNLISLCRPHHNGLKRDLERHARVTGQIARLKDWCLKPETRPEKLRRR
jgi:5-methylcytosine-specific restriction endonuclease McrA